MEPNLVVSFYDNNMKKLINIYKFLFLMMVS